MTDQNKKRPARIFFIAAITATFLCTIPAVATEKKKTETRQEELLTRIDFGNSYISGQTLKSGAVYLLQRKKSDVKTMLKYRENYRKEILESHDIHLPVSKKSETN